MKRKKNIDDLAKELYEHRHDPGEWSEEAVPVEVRPAKTAVISCRLPLEDFHALVEAMTKTGESLSEYVRKAIVLRQESEALTMPNAIMTHGTQFNQNAIWDIWSTAPASIEQTDYVQHLRLVS